MSSPISKGQAATRQLPIATGSHDLAPKSQARATVAPRSISETRLQAAKPTTDGHSDPYGNVACTD